MNILYATDLHGNRAAIEKMLEIGAGSEVDALIFGGDLTPKLVAIKLESYSDPTGDESKSKKQPLVGGGIIPLDMLKEEPGRDTYTSALKQIILLNQKIGPKLLEKELQKQGYLFYKASQYYQLDDLLLEQRALDKLSIFFGRRSGLDNFENPTKLDLSEEEMEIVRDCLIGWFKKYEKSWTGTKRQSFAEKCFCALGMSGTPDFKQIAPSSRIEECLIAALSADQMGNIFSEEEGFHKNKDGVLKKYLGEKSKQLRDHITKSLWYRSLIESTDIRALAKYSSAPQLIALATKTKSLAEGQAQFLSGYFLPLLKNWKKKFGKKIFVAFGNDDIAENIPILEKAEKEGLIHFLNGKVHSLDGDYLIAGYGFVENLPAYVGYRYWGKRSENILADLRWLNKETAGQKTVWVIHQPPYGHLDSLLIGGRLGSEGVLNFLTESQPPLALCGHVHEGRCLAGSLSSLVGKTICVNTGGDHQNGLQAAIIDLKSLTIKREI